MGPRRLREIFRPDSARAAIRVVIFTVLLGNPGPGVWHSTPTKLQNRPVPLFLASTASRVIACLGSAQRPADESYGLNAVND
jgi:hypothetical protein